VVVAIEKFVKQLEDSGIIAPGRLEGFLPPKAEPKSAEELARELVRQKQLTRFQAQEAFLGRAKSLVLGNYVLLDKLGAGGMGQVYKAQHRRMDRIVAVKMLPTKLTKSKTAVARFAREVKAAARLSHSNIVAAFDADDANGVHFLVMEYVEGSDLSALVKKNGPLPVDQAVNFVVQAARGLEFAHGEGVVHRDIKPANLLLNAKGIVKILDMGLARIEASENAVPLSELTGAGAVMGTVDYIAPEQAENTKDADARADIYSLGCTLFYLLTGEAPYQGDTLMARLLAHSRNPIPSLRAARGEVPEQVEAVFRKMVAKQVHDRYQSMTDVIADLEKCGAGQQAAIVSDQALGIGDDSGLMTFLKDIPPPTVHKARSSTLHASKAAMPRGKLIWMVGGGALGVALLAGGFGLIVSLMGGGDTPREEARAADSADEASPFSENRDGTASGPEMPDFEQWLEHVAALPAEEQVAAVRKRLLELNPGFNAVIRAAYENDEVTELTFNTQGVRDITPVRALKGLKSLNCLGVRNRIGDLSDLSPLSGMPLTSLNCSTSQVADLSPLKGMPLVSLNCGGTNVHDLSPLAGAPLKELIITGTPVASLDAVRGMPLQILRCMGTRITDLSPLEGMQLTELNLVRVPISDLGPLRGMPLVSLNCNNSRVSDLSPLAGMPLTDLHCQNTLVADLSPLKEMPLTRLGCNRALVTDLSPLAGLPLETLICDFNPERDAEILRSIKTLQTINGVPVADIWRELDAKKTEPADP
jgi:serine/threonine protein kinase/Leucine-rich repeat (LRR) protein